MTVALDPTGPARDWTEFLIAVTVLAGAIASWWRWGLPKLKARWERERDWEVLVEGRPAIPANPRTGAPEQPAVPPIASLVAQVAAQVRDIHHELHPNGGSSMKDAQQRIERAVSSLATTVQTVVDRLAQGDDSFTDITARLGRIEHQLDGELHVATRALDNAAEASRTALDTIQTAILAEPPADLT